MKKLLITLLVVFITTTALVPTLAQSKRNIGTQAKNLFFGPKIGFNYATLSKSDD
jgi:hypothetical protein